MALTKVSGSVIQADISLNTTGIITATKFVGDGSELTGVAGLGQPLSNDQTNPLSNIFKQTETLTVASGQTVNYNLTLPLVMYVTHHSVELTFKLVECFVSWMEQH